MALILIVDDLHANREFLAAVLIHHGHVVVEAEDGIEALRLARAEPPDLVITDVLMPLMDGYQLFEQLRLDLTTSHIPVVFYTAHYGESEATALALDNGVASVLTKPTSTEELIGTVDRVLSLDPQNNCKKKSVVLSESFSRDHLRLLTDKVSEQAGGLRSANARLRAIINIGLQFSSERDSASRLDIVCNSARDLFGASYAALGIFSLDGRAVLKSYCAGVDAPTWLETESAIGGMLANVVVTRKPFRSSNDGEGRTRPQRSYLVTPIASPTRVYGWLCLVKIDGTQFEEDDEQLVLALSGQVGRIYELDNEIFQRQRVELELRQQRDLAQLYLDTAEVLLLGMDVEGRITMINRNGCNLLGWTESELVGADFAEKCLPEGIRTELRGRLQQLHAGLFPTSVNAVLTKSGKERRIEWHNTVCRDEFGGITGSFSSGTDITEEFHAVRALRKAEERMRFVLKSANVGIWDLDYKTGVLEWSEVLERQYGLQPGSFPGTFEAFLECIHPEDRAASLKTFRDHETSGGDFMLPHRTLWPDGTIRYMNGAGHFQLDSHGLPDRAVGILLDVTEQRVSDERNQQGQRMEAIGRLASGVAHDFNNLLTVILGFAELMAADAAVESQHGGDLDEIIKAARRAAGLTSQLLAFSRQQVLNASPLDLNTVIGGMTGMLGRLIGEHIKVSVSLSADLDMALADRGQIEQVVMNLVVNARDAMAQGGKLTIATTNVQLENNMFHDQPMKEGRYVMLAVTDTGQGMNRETQRRLFEPFYTTKETGKGTGLGLSTTYGIVKQSKGYIWVYSEPGFGTTFKVYLPVAEGEASRMPIHTPTAPTRSVTETLLLVEDEDGVREFSRRTLSNAGYRVIESGNGDDAERLYMQQPDAIDLVVTDVVMPGCGGPELLNRLRVRTPSLKVLYMSGYTDQTEVTQDHIGSGSGYVQKPFRAVELLRHVREALDN